jgi:hypothetical protein
MKAKLRKIDVAGEQFHWRVVPVSPNYVCLRVWADGHKSKPWAEIRYRFDNPWLHFAEIISRDRERVQEVFQIQPLLPGKIAWVIQQISQRRMIKIEAHSLSYELNKDGSLHSTDSAKLFGDAQFATAETLDPTS